MNSLNQDISGKKVVMEGTIPERERTIQVHEGTHGGFGAYASTHGTAVFGTRLITGKDIRVSGLEIEKLAVE